MNSIYCVLYTHTVNSRKENESVMKLSAAYLVDQLEHYFPLIRPSHLSFIPTLEYPVLMTCSTRLTSGLVYICEEAICSALHPEEIPDHVLFLVCGGKELSPSSDCCLIPGNLPLSDVIGTVQDIFHRCNVWQETLMQGRLEDRSVSWLLNASLDFFQNPLVLLTMDFTVAASAADNPQMIRDTLFHSFPTAGNHLKNFRRSDLYSPLEEQKQVFYLPPEVGGCASLCANVRQYKKTTHSLLLLEYNHPLKRSEGFLLAFLASLLEHALQHRIPPKDSSSQALNAVLTRALNDKTADYMTVSHRLSALGWPADHDYACVFLSLRGPENVQKASAHRRICNYLENILPSSCALIHNNDIVLFVNLTLSKLTPEELSLQLLPFLKDSSLNAGFSRRMKGHLNLRRQYLQARIALSTGLRQKPEEQLHPFNRISFQYILEQSSKRLPGYMLCDENLLLLKEHDDQTGSGYMETLRLYLDNHCNVVQTARELSIHRSTLLYRLEKIKEILSFSLDDPEHLLYLRLSFYLIELEENRKNPFHSL